MMALYFMILLLICGVGVRSDESTLEVGSGDMDTQTTAVPFVNLIDGNGDIVTGVKTNPPDDLKNFTSHDDIGSATEVVELKSTESLKDELSTLKTTITEDGETTTRNYSLLPTTVTMVLIRKAEDEETSGDSTTTTETTTMAITTVDTTETPIPTTTSTTSTEIPTTAFEWTTASSEKTSMEQTTTSSSTTAATEKFDKPTGHSAQTQEEGENEICVFMSSDFNCVEENMVCYGQGEIDCSPLEDSDSSPSSKSEDYIVDEDPESATIETFPPNLVGVLAPKKILFYNNHPLYNTSSSITTEGTNETAGKDVHENFEKEMNVTTNEMVEGVSSSTSEPTVTTENAFTVVTTANANSTETVLEMTETTPAGEPSSTTILQTSTTTISLPTNASTLLSETDATTNADNTEKTSPTVSADSDASTSMPTTARLDAGVRRRRGISHEGHTPEPHYEELYKKKVVNRHDKKSNETCRLKGNIRCIPMPTTIKCIGKTKCQAVRIKSEVPAASQRKGLKVWMIVVIVICGVFGFMTVGLIIYMIVHSCKKLKVQPAHDVLPLNYMTKKSAETVETA